MLNEALQDPKEVILHNESVLVHVGIVEFGCGKEVVLECI